MLKAVIKKAGKSWEVAFVNENGETVDRYEVEKIELEEEAFLEEFMVRWTEKLADIMRKNLEKRLERRGTRCEGRSLSLRLPKKPI